LKPRLERLLTLGGSLQDADAQAAAFDEDRWQRLEEIRSEFRVHHKLRQDERDWKTQLDEVFRAAERWGAQLTETKTQLQIVKEDGIRASEQEKELRAELDRASRENIAAELVSSLSIGDPCPVCGEPLKTLPDIGPSRAPTIRAQLEQCETQVRQLREEYTVLRETQKNQVQSLEQAQIEHQKLQGRVETVQTERLNLERDWFDVLPPSDDPKSAVQEARATMLRGLAFELIQAGASDVQGHLEASQREKQRLEQLEREANSAVNRTGAQLAKSDAELQAAQAQVAQAEQSVERAVKEETEIGQQLLELERERGALEQKLSDALHYDLNSNRNPAVVLEEAKTDLLAGFAQILVSEGATNNIDEQILTLQQQKTKLETHQSETREALQEARSQVVAAQTALVIAQTALAESERELLQSTEDTERAAKNASFTDAKAARGHALAEAEIDHLEQLERDHEQSKRAGLERQTALLQALAGRSLTAPLESLEQNVQTLETQMGSLQSELGSLEAKKTQLQQALKLVKDLRGQENKLRKQNSTYQNLANDMRGNEFQDYLLGSVQKDLLHRATQTMRTITRERYSLELLDGDFCVRDSWNGLEPRSVKTLSGGESFIASLALALSLSDYLAGNQALGALFLDEGFGTLDSDALEMVANTLETLNTTGRMVGVITHVPTLAERLPTRLIIEKAQDSSRARWES
jgi:DNA repair protein SbcC/Rad50